ncbi:MAG: Sua5/YciO/YrdC/YwlC family protein [Nanoarchaeota archaeon]
MALVLSKHDLERGRIKFLNGLKEKIFVYPTDTIYGLGCNAQDEELVERLRELKEQFARPLSVIPPSLAWVRKNCVMNPLARSWLSRLPGPYTLVLKLKKRAVAQNVDLGTNKLGVRFPNHWFGDWVKETGVPMVTTSVNHLGGGFMTSLDNMSVKIKKGVDWIIYDGELKGRPSTIVDVSLHEKKKMVYLRKTTKINPENEKEMEENEN